MTFMEMLAGAWKSGNSLVCVGLDPDIAKIPQFLREKEHPLFQFNKGIIDATKDQVCAYKPQAAYYAGLDADEDLLLTIR